MNKNMLKIQNLSKFFITVILYTVVGACSNDDMIELEQKVTPDVSTIHTIPMKFIGGIKSFDQTKKGTRATGSPWNEGDKVFITFFNGDATISGEATYSSSTGWTISYTGILTSGSEMKCEVRFFTNATFMNSSLISLNSNSEIYESLDGQYSYVDGALTIYAALLPKTGRLKFKGTEGAIIHISGISVFTSFSPATNTFTSSKAVNTLTVASDGYTPYIYGLFPDDDKQIGLVGSDFAFTRTCTSEVLTAGSSGYMAIPSENSHDNWKDGLYVKVSGVGFIMIPVTGYSEGFFLIGETEVTEALYYNVNGRITSSSLLPISNIRMSDAVSTIEIINDKTGMHFNLPTNEQWLYAASGGNKSLNYIYSGSNTPGDVAWYSANASTKQNVKTKTPNELGIYDMSGNVAEMSYLSIYTRTNYKAHGGSFSSSSSGIAIDSYEWYETDSYYNNVGFRLVLTFP